MAPVPVTIRTSERTSFKKCRQAWQWAYVDHLRTKKVRSALAFGSLIHAGLEHYYIPGIKRGPSPVDNVIRIYGEYLDDGGQEFFVGEIPALDLAVEMMKNYLLEYGKDERYKVIMSEATFQVDVFDPRTGKYLFTYVGTCDGIWYDRQFKKLVILETKTGAGLTPFGAPEALDEQSGSYFTFVPDWARANGYLRENEEIDHLLFNRMRKAMGDHRPVDEEGNPLNKPKKDAILDACDALGLEYKKSMKVADLTALLKGAGQSDRDIELLGEISETERAPLFLRTPVYRGPGDRASIYNRVLNEAREMKMVRNGRLAVYKNPDSHCGYCEFREMCEVHETGSDWEAMRDNQYTVWDPYEDHEDGMSDSPEA